MPYVICAECRVTTYSAALWSGTDECPSCGAHLAVGRRGGPAGAGLLAGGDLLPQPGHEPPGGSR
jgi:hypothetical protein